MGKEAQTQHYKVEANEQIDKERIGAILFRLQYTQTHTVSQNVGDELYEMNQHVVEWMLLLVVAVAADIDDADDADIDER